MSSQVPDPKQFGKVALLLGGVSAERAVSLKSGAAVLAAMQRSGVDVEAIDAGATGSLADVVDVLKDGGFDRVFNIMHGRGGEDGVIQGALDLLGLPYTGTGVLGSALGMDKVRTKQVWKAVGLPTPEYRVVTGEDQCAETLQALGLPLFVKPAQEGSSIGTFRVDRAEELVVAWREASQFDSPVLVEQCIEGGEFTAAVLDGQALPLIKMETPNTFYDYEAKYQADSTQYRCPCGLPQDQEARFKAMALTAFEAVAASGWGRVDFMLDAEGQPWLLEINTVPGMTDHSLVPMAANQAGIGFDELVLRILATSLREAGRQEP